MSNYKIKFACRNYDRTSAVLRGLIKAEGIDLQGFEMKTAPEMFMRMHQGEFDVSEFSLAELVYYTSRGKSNFVGIPVFPFRMFRHGYLYCNSSIKSPESLDGIKIGFPILAMTACVWQRGILVDHCNVSAKNTRWYVAASNHWNDGEEKDEVKPRDGSAINWLERQGKDTNQTVDTALLEGKIDLLGTPRPPTPFVVGDGRVKRLFENYKEVEVSYFKKTRIYPIMHVLVARKSLVEEHSDLPVKLFELFSQSKKLGKERLRTDTSLSLVWKDPYIDEEQELFQGDPWAYGLEKNRHVISTFLSYCYDLGVSERRINPEELFVPSTWELTEL